MIGFIVVVIAIMATGHGIARRLFARAEPHDNAEVFVAGAVIGIAMWIAMAWVLAITHTLTATALRVLTLAFVGAALVFARTVRFTRPRAASICTLIVLALWSLFILWRGSVVPPANHDALTYHLPRAVMIARAHGIERFDVSDARIRDFPANYELLLASVIVLEGDDVLTEWIATVFWMLFLGGTALLARSWWGKGPHVAASALAVAGAPLLLLHSGADKNDVMTGAFVLGALFWSARWCAQGGIPSATLAILCGVLAVGTKLTAGMVVLAIAPFGLIALLRRRPPLQQLLSCATFAAIAFLVCGGWIFIQNAASSPASAGTTVAEGSTVAGLPAVRYGKWSNLRTMPLTILRVSAGRPFWLPGNDDLAWPPYNMYASHFGMIFAPLVLALPFCIARYRRDSDTESRTERRIVSLSALLAFLALLVVGQEWHIAVPSILRYAVFALPVVVGWTVAPIVRELASLRRRFVVRAAFAILVAIFAQQSVECVVLDAHVPFDYVRWAAAHPGTRRVRWLDRRAGSIVDRMAGPYESIAIPGEGDAAIHPAYGAKLTRPVVILGLVPRAADIPPSAQWVAIDRTYTRWTASAREVPLVDDLRRDCHFRLMHWDPAGGQAVFRRTECSSLRE